MNTKMTALNTHIHSLRLRQEDAEKDALRILGSITHEVERLNKYTANGYAVTADDLASLVRSLGESLSKRQRAAEEILVLQHIARTDGLDG